MGWIGVDLDPAMVERVKRWLAEGRDVRILTARVNSNQGPRTPGAD